ncbi:MAG: peptidoglycan DD-metalloendopeptidase family protein [Cyanobacteria bacterium P01_A01_bin.84]
MKLLFLRERNVFRNLNPFLCGLLCFLLITFSVFSITIVSTPAQTIKQLRQQQQQVKQKSQNINQEKNHLTILEKEAQERLGGLEKNLKITNNNIEDSQKRLQQAQQRLEELQTQLAIAENYYKERQNSTVARLRFLQRSPIDKGWAVLLQSHDMNDFFSRRRQLKLVYNADQQILNKLTLQASKIKQQRTDVEFKKNEIALIRQQLLAQKTDYETHTQVQEKLIARLNSDRNALEAAQAQLEKDSLGLGRLIQQKVAEAKAREIAKARSKRIWIRGSGIMAFPTDARISSPYGYRTHPVLGYRRLHTGMDFAASYGTNIRAANSGTVIYSGWYGGYGKAVIINHGKGITTLYGHNSKLYVSEGDTVKRGQPISAVGSTGLSTGPHLHFEVRKNGTPVNPANYF